MTILLYCRLKYSNGGYGLIFILLAGRLTLQDLRSKGCSGI